MQALAAPVEDRKPAVEARPAPQKTPELPTQAAKAEPSAETAEAPSRAVVPPAKAQPKRRRAWLVPVIGALAILLSCGALQLLRGKSTPTVTYTTPAGTSEPSGSGAFMATGEPSMATMQASSNELMATMQASSNEFMATVQANFTSMQTPQSVAKAGGDVIKIAILAPLSGDLSSFGTVTGNGVLLAIEDYAKAHNGGVLGMTIEATVEDSQCSVGPAVKAANKVIDQDKIHYIVGEVCSSASVAVSEIANAKKVLQISPTSIYPAVTVDSTGKTKDYVFRACFIDTFQGTVGANFALKTLGAKNAFILYDQSNDYAKGLAEYFEQAFVAGEGRSQAGRPMSGPTPTSPPS